MSKSEKRTKTTMVMLRMTPDDRAALAQRAMDVKKTLPDYLISSGLQRPMRTVANDHIVNELRRLGELQRQLHEVAGTEAGSQYTTVLVEILAAIRRIGR